MPKVVLAIGAHPDDIEFGCSGSLAKLASEGAEIYYLVCTDGNRGSRQHAINNAELVKARRAEQTAASKMIGAKELFFLEEEDGNLVANLELKEKIVKVVRKLKPDIVFSHDPSYIYRVEEDGHAYVNHNDHRQTGIATLDAVYPLARDLASFPDHANENLTPHTVTEVLLYWPKEANYQIDISEFLETKIQGILAHKSQIDDPKSISKWAKKYHAEQGQKAGCQYAESFSRLLLD